MLWFSRSCTLDLLELEPERTHERWQPLDDGFGSVHFALTMCIVGKEAAAASSDARLENIAVEKYVSFRVSFVFILVSRLSFVLPVLVVLRKIGRCLNEWIVL